MGRDRYERRHRKTAANTECVAMMANANFDAVPSLAEAMGLVPPTHTHTGFRRRDIHSNVYGKKRCVTHAFAFVAGVVPDHRGDYTALCGETVHCRKYDDWGEEAPNIRACTDPRAAPLTCVRCLKILKG